MVRRRTEPNDWFIAATTNSRGSAALLLAAALLTLIFSFTAEVYWQGPHAPYLVGYLSNVSAGLLTSAAILFFVDRAIEQREESIRKRLSALAARLMQPPLSTLIMLFQSMIVSAASEPIRPDPDSCAALFSDENLKHLDWFNLDARCSFDDSRPWAAVIYETIKDELDRVRGIGRAYESRLDHEFLESIELLLEDDFGLFLRGMALNRSEILAGKPLPPWVRRPVGLNGHDARREVFFKRFTTVVEHVERLLGKTIGPDHVSARFGSPRSARLAALYAPMPITNPEDFPAPPVVPDQPLGMV